MTTTPQVPGAEEWKRAIESAAAVLRCAAHWYRKEGTLALAKQAEEARDALLALATLPEPAAAPAAGEPTRDGPGTVPYRFHRLMEELEKRFQDPEPFSAKPAEPRYFAMLDAALAAATPSVPQTHPGETDTYIDSVVQAADAHGRMRNPATQRSLDGAKIDLGRHLRQIASSSKTAPPVQVEDYVLQRAADMLTAYAELVKATGQYAEQHYIPELEYVVSELRAARGQSEHG